MLSLVILLLGCSDKSVDDSSPPTISDTAIKEDTGGVTRPDDTADDGPPDADGDGYSAEEDCNDNDPDIAPGAEEIAYDGIDQDCDGSDLTDVDGDGEDAEIVGGADCDDSDPDRWSGAYDVPDDGIDQDCDGADAIREAVWVDLPSSSIPFIVNQEFSRRVGGELGAAVVMGSDFNGDGIGDIVLGDPRGESGGNLHLVLGSPTETVTLPADSYTTLIGEHEEHWIGSSLSLAGDVDGDGYDDLWVGSSGGPHGFNDYANRFYLLKGPIDPGSRDIYNSSAAVVFGRDLSHSLGHRISGNADVDLDGVPDVLITEDNGYAYLITSTNYLSGDESLDDVLSSRLALGEDAKFVGDLNGDGYTDIVTLYSTAAIFFGPANNLYAERYEDADKVIEPTDSSGSLQTVVGAGDVDGDGYSEFILGDSSLASSSSNPPGDVYLFSGADIVKEQTVEAARTIFKADEDTRRLGYAMSSSDLDNDGRSDVLITAPFTDSDSKENEYAFLFFNPSDGQHIVTDADVVFTSSGEYMDDRIGSAVSIADIDGDGQDDLLFGAMGTGNYIESLEETLDLGGAYLFYGDW